MYCLDLFKTNNFKNYIHVCMADSLCCTVDIDTTGSSVHGVFSGKNTGVGRHLLLQGIFLTQGLNPCLLHLLHHQVDSYHCTTREAQKLTLLQ